MAFSNLNTQHEFARNEAPFVPHSGMDRSHTVTTTFDAGYLIPFYVDEVIPGDTFKIDCSLFARMLTPAVPFMDNLWLDTQFFFVPYRLLWENWERMHGAKNNPDDHTDYICPTVTIPANSPSQTIFDYMGIPPYVGNSFEVNSLPLRAYNMIWNEWYRDANLQDSVPFEKGDADDVSNYTLLRRGKRKDYFTSALPFPQAGDPVTIALGDKAPVVYGPTSPESYSIGGVSFNSITHESSAYGQQARISERADSGQRWDKDGSAEGFSMPVRYGWTLEADISQASAISINALREAVVMQQLLEADARGGSQRYTSMLEAHFGVKNPDLRLFRPEYLGGSSTRLSVFSVPQTSESTADSAQGNLAAYATAQDSKGICHKSFGEFGIIIGLCSVRAGMHYQYGLNRMWSRSTRFDYYYPLTANLGEQAILNKEIYLQGTDQDEDVFGYQERWAELRFHPSMITGKLRSQDPQSLDVWHLAQKFENLPTLSAEFIEENPPVDRVVAVQDEPQFKLDALVDLKCHRPIPLFSVPGLNKL